MLQPRLSVARMFSTLGRAEIHSGAPCGALGRLLFLGANESDGQIAIGGIVVTASRLEFVHL